LHPRGYLIAGLRSAPAANSLYFSPFPECQFGPHGFYADFLDTFDLIELLDSRSAPEYDLVASKLGNHFNRKEVPMIREYDLFERFPDGSSLWRASVWGLEGTHSHLRRLAEKSDNQFYAIEITSGKTIHAKLEGGAPDFFADPKSGRRSKSAAA